MLRHFVCSSVSDLKYEHLFLLSSDILGIVGFDGYFKHLSPACEEILGFNLEELIAIPFLEFVHPDDRMPTLAIVQQLVMGERVDRFENRYRCKNGSYKWLSWSGIGVVEEGLIYCTARDITAQKQAEVALQQSKQYYEALIHSLNGIIWEFDLRTQKFLFVSQKAEEILGYPVEQWLTEAHFWENHIHPEDREWVTHTCHQFVLQRQEGQLEYRMIATDGSIVWLQDIVSLVIEAEQPIKLRGLLINISNRKRLETERIQIEQAFRTSEQRFRTLSQCAPVGIYMTDADVLQCTYVNDRWCELTQLTADQAIGAGWVKALHPDDQQRVFEEWQAALQNNREFILEYRYLHPDGTIVWVSGRAIALRDQAGQVSGFIGTVSDITERRQMELALRKSEARFQAFMQYSPIVAWLTAADGRLLYANPPFLNRLQFPTEKIFGKTLFEVFPPDIAQQFFDNNNWVIQFNQVLKTVESALLADGTV
ncbi:MAG: PAS domain S-box protein, partial [Kovacikia sp.]